MKKKMLSLLCLNLTIGTILISELLITNVAVAIAGQVTFEKEYAYQAGEADSKLSCRAIALEQVKRLLLEELGVYLEAKTEVKNYQLTKDQITLLTAGVVGSEIVNEKWDGRTYYLKAKISADPEDVAKRLDSLRKDEQKTKELERARKKADELLKELEKLKSELKTVKAAQKDQKQREVNIIINGLNALDWFEKSRVLVQSGNYRDAIEALNNSIKSDPLDASAYALRGYVYSLIENSEKALDNYNKAIKLKPDLAEVYHYRGAIYLQLGLVQAKKEFDVAWNKMDDTSKVKLLEKLDPLSYPLANSKDFQRGMRDLDKAIEINPNYVSAYIARGLAYCSIGEYLKGLNDYDRVIAIDPQNVAGYLARAAAYSSIGNSIQAISDFDKALELSPKDPKIYFTRGMHFANHVSLIQGVKDIEKAIGLDPKNSYYYYMLGLQHGLLGNKEEEIGAMKISARLGNKDAQKNLQSRGVGW